mmetsp:Transcript_26072/g.49244  ORF Transcript_26072/g.49244 Transcript_26072/m.49244 type:complete len:87 (+) Transcript_26072:51-311(+)
MKELKINLFYVPLQRDLVRKSVLFDLCISSAIRPFPRQQLGYDQHVLYVRDVSCHSCVCELDHDKPALLQASYFAVILALGVQLQS